MTENMENNGCPQRDSAEHKGYAEASRSFNRIWKERDRAQPKLLEAILHKDNLIRANKGAAGSDGMTVEEALPYLREHQQELINRIYRGKYTPSPVRRVEIPKPDGGVRKLGIPTVTDRTIQQAIAQQLMPIYEPLFADGSYGYRPNRSAKDAILKIKEYAQQGYTYAVSLDLSKYFDTLNHEILINLLRKNVKDERVVQMIKRYLKSGVMENGVVMSTEEGSPQGGNLSPLLANIYLNEFDQEYAKRGVPCIRYADDIVLLAKSRRASERLLESSIKYLEGELKLTVNREKSHTVSVFAIRNFKYLDTWAEEELKTGTLSNGTVGTYLQAINRIKQHPISNRKLKTVTSEHLQKFMDLLAFGGTVENFVSKGYSIDYIQSFSAVLQQSFRFAVFPKQYITFNPMQYVVMKRLKEDTDLFATEEDTDNRAVNPLSYEQYQMLIEQLGKRSADAILPVQISYFTGLRLGEVCGLTWKDINLDEQYLTVRRSIRYSNATHSHEIGPTKRKKVRVVDFGDTLADILKKARKQQLKNRMQYGELYHRNFYKEVKEKNRVHYEYYNLGMNETVPKGYSEIALVCLREDGCLELPATVETACRSAARKVPELEGFHFHALRHTYTTNLLSNGAQPKDVQELLGHSDVSTTMNVYAHATREAKRDSARLMDKVVGLY